MLESPARTSFDRDSSLGSVGFVLKPLILASRVAGLAGIWVPSEPNALSNSGWNVLAKISFGLFLHTGLR